MEKNLEKSLKRYLKRKVKITTAFIVAFLLGSLAVYGATLDEIFANGELVKHSTKVGYEEKEFKIRYDKNNNSIVLEWSSGVWKKNSEIKIDSLNEVQKNSLLKSLEAFANSAQEELKPTTTENGINNGIILNIGDTETSSDPASAQEIASGVIINKGDIYSGGTVFITYSQNITGKNGVAVNDGNIYGIGSVGQKAFMGTVINNGNIFSNGQDIDNSVGINNGNIFLINKGWNNEAQGQEIKSNGIGVNAGNINSSYDDYSVTAQKIEGIGINVSDIFFTTNVSTVTGQKVASGVGINNKNIKLFSNKYDSMGQEIGGMGFNNGMISSEVSDKSNNGTAYGQKINTAGVGINNGVIYSSNANKDEEYGQTTDYNGVGINNGIIVADKAYYKRDYWSTFYKNGIALKKDDTGKLVINTGSDNYGEEYNKNIDILGKDKLTTSNKLSEVITNNNITQKDVGETSDGTKVKGYNLFINNLGNETDDSDKNNQLVIDTDLTGSFVNTHITTAVTNGNFDNNNGAVIKISKSGNTDKTFLMDKSTIAGYFEQNGTLADMTGATDITLSNSVISVSGKDNTIDTTAVKFGAGSTVALNSSTISGKIDFSAGGNNALNLNGKYNGDNNNSYKDGTQYGTYASDIEFGTGNDNIDIKFTETKDGNEVTDYNSSYDKKGLVTLGNVNFGDGNDTLSFSFDEMRKGNFVLAGDIDFGAGNDTVALKSKIDMNDKGETITLLNNFLFNKITKNQDGTSTLETLQLADTGNTIRFEQNIGQDKLSLDFNGKILGGSGEDIFVVDLDKIQNYDFDGKDGTDYIQITEKYDESKISSFEKFSERNIEGLKLGDFENTVDIDNLLADDKVKLTHLKGGNTGDTFIINGTDETKKNKVLGMVIGGGSSENDTLKVNTNITTEQLSSKTGIENLELGLNKDTGYNIDFTYKDNTDETKTLEDFKNIKSGNGDDNFTVSVDHFEKLFLIDGGGNKTAGDSLTINGDFKVVTNIKEDGTVDDTLFNKIQNIENLEFGSFTDAQLNLNNLTSEYLKNLAIKLGGLSNEIYISTSNLKELKGLTGTTNTALKITNAVTDRNDTFDFLAKGDGTKGINSIKKIYFSENSIGNTLTLTETLRAKNIEFKTFDKNNAVNVDIKEDVNKIKTFEHTVTNAGKIILEKGKFEWKFADNSTINGKNTVLDLNENTLNLLNNEEKISDSDNIPTDKIINSGNIGLENGNLIFGDLNFVADGKVEVTNGKIKIGFDSSVKFSNGANTKFTLNEGKEIAFGSGVTFTTPYNFIKVDGTNISVKQWNEYQGYNPDFSLYAGRYDEVLKKYNGTDKESIAVTNALNGFSEKNIFKFVTDKQGDKLVYYSDEDSTPYDTKVTGEDILIKTNPDTTKDQDMNLTFNNISSSGNIKIEVTGGKDNTVTFGNVEKDSDSFVSVNSIDGSSSTKDLTLNFNGKTNNADKIVINNQNSNKINISGNTTIKEITFGDGADNIYLGENSQNVTIDKINFGAGDDKINIGSTGTINLSNINLGAGDNKIYFRDISKVENFDIVKSDGDNGTNEIEITETKNNSDAFNIILAGADKDVEKITVWGENKLQITNDFSGELLFSESRENVIDLKTSYTGDIKFTKGENTVNISENGSIDGTKLYLAGSKNILSVNSGTVTNGITFEENSYGNKVIVSENGNIGKDIIFGTEKGTDDEFTIALKDNGIFDYNVTNADVINISGIKGEINFGENSSITSNSEITLNTNGGVIAFNINKNGNIISKNPFGNTSVKVNGDIKITLDSSVKFESLSDTIKLSLGNIKSDSILTSAFLNYNGREFSIKSAEELKAFGLGDYAFGNYEYAILNYNKAGYEGITSMLNNNSLTDISKALNKGIEQKDFYFYSDDREIKDKITLGNINIETSKDNQVTGENLNTDIKFENVTGGTANINFAQGTTNSVSFLDGVNISKIDGSSSNAGFTLNLDGINFSKSQDAKDNTEVVMSDYADTLNINSKLEGIGINTGDGEDIVNISSYVKNITLNTGAGNDTVNILSSANGIFDGDSGDNTLNIGAKTQTLSNENSQDEIVLNGEIKNFQDINLNQNTKLESSLKISQNNQSEKINLNLNGNSLFVDVDYTKKADDKVIGHALYDNGIKVDNSTGKVMIDTAKANDGTIISLGTVGNKTEFASTDKEHLLESGSSNHHIEMIDGDIGFVNIF